MPFLTGAKDILALRIIVLADPVVAIGFLIVARVPVLHSEVWLAELGRAIAVLREVTLVATRPTLGSSRKELKRKEEEEAASENRNLSSVLCTHTTVPSQMPRRGQCSPLPKH